MIPTVFLLVMSASLSSAKPIGIENIVDEVVARHMSGKQIPGMSVAVVHQQRLIFSKGYGLASIELDVKANANTVYPISSVSRTFAGVLAMRLMDAGLLNLDGVPAGKRAITVRHLLQHTHGLEDFYRSDTYVDETGQSAVDSSTQQLIDWSLHRPPQSPPGDNWNYGVVGYVILGQIFEKVGGSSYKNLVQEHVFSVVDMNGAFGGSEVVVPGRHPMLYELVDDEVVGHVVDFPERVWPAGGLNMSVVEMAKLFIAISGDEFLDQAAKQELWRNITLPGGKKTNYGLGWSSYITSQDRWVVGHEGGGASWVIYYPDQDLAVIALSNMSGARADILPYEIARAIFKR